METFYPTCLDNHQRLAFDEVKEARTEVKNVVFIPKEAYVILESIAELPPPNWPELVTMTNDPETAPAAVIYASPTISGELARIVLENGLIRPTNSELT